MKKSNTKLRSKMNVDTKKSHISKIPQLKLATFQTRDKKRKFVVNL